MVVLELLGRAAGLIEPMTGIYFEQWKLGYKPGWSRVVEQAFTFTCYKKVMPLQGGRGLVCRWLQTGSYP